MGEKGNDGGQFFTPREIIRAMVQSSTRSPGETVYDPGCGTGGFLAAGLRAHDRAARRTRTAEQIEALSTHLLGPEKENQVYPIALANLVCTASTGRISGTATR